MRFPDPRRLLIYTIALLCLLHSVGGAGAVTGESGAAVTVDAAAEQVETPANNTSVQQENPDDVDESGDSDAMRSYLSSMLSERLGQSSAEISRGEYEQGQSVLGDEYDDLLEKYVEIEGGTGDSTDTESFEEASENQREYGATLQEYNETYQAYQAARQDGNETRARELARELDRLQTEITESGGNLTTSYSRIENTTGGNLSSATQDVNTTTRTVQEQHEEVVATTFVRTNLSATTDATTVSFENPATVVGQITLENGTALANETVDVQIGERVRTVQTDDSGTFSLDYRPVAVADGAENVSVAYRPSERSIYLGSNASLDVTVSQTTAEVTVETATETARFGDNVTVSGRADVNGTPVDGARIQVRVGGDPLGTAETADNGTYRLTTALNASVPDGNSTVQAAIVPANRAVRSEPATIRIQVEQTGTSINVTAERTVDGVRISGALATVDGDRLTERTVELRLAGSTVASVETGSNGTFERVVAPANRSGTVTVRAVYDEPSTNLGAASAETQLTLPDETEERNLVPVAPELLAGGGVVALSMLAIVWLVRRDGTPTETAQPQTPTVSTTAETSSDTATNRVLLDQASSLLANGDSEAAIRALYSAVRRSIQIGDSTQTHWEFYTAASDRLEPGTTGTLERLTEAYEQVVYSPEDVEAETAGDLLEEAETLLGEGDSESAG